MNQTGVKLFEESGGEVTRRKSARISALEEKKNKACTLENESVIKNQAHVRRGNSTSRKGRKRKRLEDVGVSSPQDNEDTKDKEYSIYEDEATYMSYLRDSETRVLEFILDTLQRRDTSNLFTKPVNPQEVLTYYKIIKEPMDFGTMRAKLQEGKYITLEQFEHDVNLISTNAIHVNASTTVFYQEAQDIQELAQQLFRSLRDDPDQFQLQFSLTKRRPSRKPQNQDRGSHGQVPRPVGRPSSLRRSYVRRNSQAGLSNANSSGIRDGGNSNFLETERRKTCRLSDEDKSLLSVVLDSAKILCYNGNGHSGYKESLMRFSKNLGPTAQKIAESKLAQPFSQLTVCQLQATPPIQTQNYMDHASPVLALPAPEAPGHLLDGNKGQMHHGSSFHLPRRDSNGSYFHGDATAQGHARTNNVGIHINDSVNRRSMNPPSTSQLGMVPNYRDKGKMVVDLNQNSVLVGTGDTEGMTYPQNFNSNVRLESHIRVARDYSSPGSSSSGIKFRAVDMLGKLNPQENQQQFQPAHQSPSSTVTSNSGILSWAVNTLANTSRQENQQLQSAQLSSTGSSNQSSLLDIMAGRSIHLKSSSSSLRSSPGMLSTSWQDFGSQLSNNNAVKSAQTGQQLQCSQHSAEQDMQEGCSFLDMLGGSTQWERSTLLREHQHLDEGNYSLGSNSFMINQLQPGEINCQSGITTSMREDLSGDSTTQWGSSIFQRKEQHRANGNYLLENNAFFRQEQQLNGGTLMLGSGTFLRKGQHVDEESFHLGNSTYMRQDQLGEVNLTNFQFGNGTFLRTEQQFDQGTFPLGKTSVMSQEPQLDRGNLQMGNGMLMSKEQVLNEGSFEQGNSTFMSNGQRLDEGSFPLGKSICMRTEKQIGQVNPQWWNNSFMSKDQQTSTFLKKYMQPLGRSEQKQPVGEGVTPGWYSAICSTNGRATGTGSSSTQWYQKETVDESLVSLFLVDNQQPNLALQL